MMKRDDCNLSNDDSVTQLDKNLSRLLKLTGHSNQPGSKFMESLINDVINKLKHPEVNDAGEENIKIRSGWLERVIGWAAMIAVAGGVGLVFVISVFLKMNLLIEIVVVFTMVFNWLSYLGGHV
jgi:hypothetical protein